MTTTFDSGHPSEALWDSAYRVTTCGLASAAGVSLLFLTLDAGSWPFAAKSYMFASSIHASHVTTESNGVNLQFIHIPKTGGTSIELWGKENGFRWGKYDRSLKGDKKTGDFRCNSWHTPQPVSMESFCVLRQPFDRLLSEFRHRTCEKDAQMSCDPVTFNTWARDIFSGPWDANDCHILPQISYLEHCDNVLAYDDVQDQFTRLLTSHGFDGGDTKLNIVRQPRDNLRSGCNPKCTISYSELEEDVRATFEAIYHDDVERWGSITGRRLPPRQKQQVRTQL